MDPFKNAKPRSDISWNELDPAEHLVHIYDDADCFLDSLESFVAAGLREGESVAVIATPPQLANLETRLMSQEIDVSADEFREFYISIDADQALDEVTDGDGWPNYDRFSEMLADVIERADRNGPGLRAYGGLVSLLWSKGNNAATLRLESLWEDARRHRPFPILHAYPKSAFTDYHLKSLHDLCEMHSRVIR